MKYEVAKSGPVALSPAVAVNKLKGAIVTIADENHAEDLIGAGILKSLKGAPKNKMMAPPDNKDDFSYLLDLSEDELRVKYEEVFGKKAHHKTGVPKLIEELKNA